jgi:hypothetical protein
MVANTVPGRGADEVGGVTVTVRICVTVCKKVCVTQFVTPAAPVDRGPETITKVLCGAEEFAHSIEEVRRTTEEFVAGTEEFVPDVEEDVTSSRAAMIPGTTRGTPYEILIPHKWLVAFHSARMQRAFRPQADMHVSSVLASGIEAFGDIRPP